jgi:hypothetical protein
MPDHKVLGVTKEFAKTHAYMTDDNSSHLRDNTSRGGQGHGKGKDHDSCLGCFRVFLSFGYAEHMAQRTWSEAARVAM